ncbi:HNH endonuclease [Gordonia phage Morrissey]|nr:HNH endonuclease [Gordonia phage Morrissey]
MKIETWRDHPDYPVIQVSDQGRVYRKPRTVIRGQDTYTLKGRIAALNTGSKTGHLKVPIRMGGRYFHAWVHRLVLEAFVGPCPSGMETRHLNGNPKDNRLENLVWGTSAENSQDTKNHGYVPPRRESCKHGHLFTPENTYYPPARSGDRHCKECQRSRVRKYREEHR